MAVSMVATMSACGKSGTSSSASPEASTTPSASTAPSASASAAPAAELTPESGATLKVWESKEERPFVEAIAKEFTDKYGVPVTVEEVGAADQVGKLTTDGPAGLGADVVVFPHDNLGKAVAAGLVLPNEDFKDVSTKENSELAVKATTFDGTLYGYPRSVETYALFYNKDLVKTPPKTYDDVIAFAKTYNDTKKDKYAYMWEVDNFYFAYTFLATPGGYVFGNKGQDKNDIGLNNDASVAGAKVFASLKKEVLPLKSGDVTYDIKKGLFTSGKLAMDVNGPWTIGEYKKAGINFGVTTLPTISGKPSVSFSGVKAWYVNSFTKYPNAAKLFSRFASTKEAQLKDFEMTGALPANTEAQADPKVANDEISKGFVEQFKNSYPMPSIPEMGNVWDPAKTALGSIWNDGKDPKAALDDAVASIKESISSAAK